jgi:4a-hydroxytetrahydrobiopterin dehydratase
MELLAHQRCVACRAGAPTVTATERDELQTEIPEWTVTTVGGIERLERTFSFKNFSQALAFTNKVAELAEAEGHHPAILVEWGRATVSWWTHKIKGQHRNDFIMAAKTDQLYVEMNAGT